MNKNPELEKTIKRMDDEELQETVDRIGTHKALYTVGLDKILTHDPEKIQLMAPVDFLNEIDLAVKTIDQYVSPLKAGKKKASRIKWQEVWVDIVIEFGHWSHLINKVIREHLKGTAKRMGQEKDPEGKAMNLRLHEKFSWVNAYWWNRLHWIDQVLKSQSGLGGISKKRGMENGRKTLHDLITGKANPNQLHPAFKEIIQNLKMASISPGVKKTLDKM